jgi:hypothetical protein
VGSIDEIKLKNVWVRAIGMLELTGCSVTSKEARLRSMADVVRGF